MTRMLREFAFLIALLAVASCGSPTVDMVFNTSTEAYPVVSDSDFAALAGAADEPGAPPVSSVVRIEMQGVGEAAMRSILLQSLVLRTRDGDLGFVQLAKCYVQPKSGSQSPILVGRAEAADLSDDAKSLVFKVQNDTDLASVLKNPFRILVEIRGDRPVTKTSVYGDLTFKAQIEI